MKRLDNRYEVGLLWRDENTLSDSKVMAKRRLECVERKLLKDEKLLESYNNKITEYIAKGYAKKLNSIEQAQESNKKWYIPHFMVYNPNKPDKQRLVFDAAAKVGEVSLNSSLLVGPDLYKSLPSVLCKFREGKVAVAADIKEMFHQIVVRPDDQLAQRFLWREGNINKPPEEYSMLALPFGLACSPCVAQYVKNEHAKSFIELFPRAVEAIVNRHYVDDLLDSFECEADAIQVCREVAHIQSSAGFEMHDWLSNMKSVAEELSGLSNTVNIADSSKSLDF